MLSITFLGTAAATPTVDRNVSGLAVQREGETLLFDCGEGNQRQMMRYGVGFAFREIFFTHYHADHLLGVTGLLRTMGLQDRSAPVTLYGPKGAQRILGAAINLGIERNKFPVEIVEIKPGDRLARDEYEIVVFETEHRADTVGYALVEHIRLGRFNPDRARTLGIPEGPLWGQLHKGKTVQLPDGRTVGPADLVGAPRSGRTLVYSGDTRPHLSADRSLPRRRSAGARGHLRWRRDGARQGDRPLHRGRGGPGRARGRRPPPGADPHQLALHREAAELLAEARAVFPETVIARDGMTVDVPYADGD